jgi:hypothetical protein
MNLAKPISESVKHTLKCSVKAGEILIWSNLIFHRVTCGGQKVSTGQSVDQVLHNLAPYLRFFTHSMISSPSPDATLIPIA